jgi:cysteine synthase A
MKRLAMTEVGSVKQGFCDAVGNTPLIKLRRASEITGCEILGKAEFLNPGGSVKDRAALGIILDAEDSGLLKPGGLIVEGTAGNTGIGLALAGNARGYRALIVMPETQSQEKIDMLKLAGAEIILVPAAPYSDAKNYVRQSEIIAAERKKTEKNGVVWANQWDNPANRGIHRVTTAPEIWEQTNGAVDGFICAIGTGGTLAGVSQGLRERNPNISIGLADPQGAAMHSYFTSGALISEGSSITEGIGQGRITQNVAAIEVNHAFQIPDSEAVPIVHDLTIEEGLCLGGSSGVNIAGAIRLAKKMGPGHTIVTILCDGGQRYQSKLFNPTFLEEKGLPVPNWLAR